MSNIPSNWQVKSLGAVANVKSSQINLFEFRVIDFDTNQDFLS